MQIYYNQRIDFIQLFQGNKSFLRDDYIARDEDLPFVRWGFPILDRQGHQYFPTVGYKGGIRLLEKILGVLLDRKDRDDTEPKFELVL